MKNTNADFEQAEIILTNEQIEENIQVALSMILDDDIFDELQEVEKNTLLNACREILKEDPELLLSNDYQRERKSKNSKPIPLGKTKSFKGYKYPISFRIYNLKGMEDSNVHADLYVTEGGLGRNVDVCKNCTKYSRNVTIRGTGFNSSRIKLGGFSNDCLVIYKVGRRTRP